MFEEIETHVQPLSCILIFTKYKLVGSAGGKNYLVKIQQQKEDTVKIVHISKKSQTPRTLELEGKYPNK